MIKVAIITSDDSVNLQNKINDFFDQEVLSEQEIIDIKYSHAVWNDEILLAHDSFSALILYKENENKL